jgi:phosphate transport system permease protein
VRRWVDRGFWCLTGTAALVACGLLLGIVVFLLRHGLPALSWSFLVRDTVAAGAGGGIVYQLLGTVILIATAFVTAAPLSLALALTATVYARRPGTRHRFEVALYALNGLPSIVLGVVGLIVFGKLLGWGKSWLAGGLILGWMILPTVTLALVERIRAIPRRYFEAAAALGLPRGRIVRSVVLPQSLGGLVSGSLLGLARAAGETAPILFTATVFSGASLPTGIRDNPVLALPYHIFVLAQDSLDPEAGTRLWAAACVLLTLVLLLSLAALPARLAAHEEARHG